jgi:hypothetical protein
MSSNPHNKLQRSFSSGNTGTAGTIQQSRDIQRSLIRHESGNKGTQLCLIESPLPYLVPGEKKRGTNNTSARPGFWALIPHSRVPGNFEFSRVNKGECELFSLTDLKPFDLRY